MTEQQTEDQVEATTEVFPYLWQRGNLTAAQHDYLLLNLSSTRVAKRSQGGKELSYLEAWDVRAHLIRVFGFGNFDAEVTDVKHVFTRDYMTRDDKPMQEIAYLVTVRLVIRDDIGREVARYSEAAVGSASGGSGFGDLHDNAVKQGASDALKRCAINLGTQFGLSLYNDGSRQEIVRNVLVRPEGATRGIPPSEAANGDLRPDQQKILADSLGAEVVSDTPTSPHTEAGMDEAKAEGPQFDRQINTPEATQEQLGQMEANRG